MYLSRHTRSVTQRTVNEWVGGECKYRNIDNVGDPTVQRRENDGIHSMGYQNICVTTMNSGLDIADELDTMREFGTTRGVSEINKP